jgi:hypothetical protein
MGARRESHNHKARLVVAKRRHGPAPIWLRRVGALKDSGFTIEPRVWKFGHGVEIAARKGQRQITVIASFHPSRQNTNTGKLTAAMFDAIFTRVGELLR